MTERDPSWTNVDRGRDAEEAAADEYGLDVDRNEWFDLVNPRTGSKYQVKRAESQQGFDAGRFRVFRGPHRSLTASDGQATAWYVFVLYGRYGDERRAIQRRKPSTVTKIVAEMGGWSESGHSEYAAEKKIPVDRVI